MQICDTKLFLTNKGPLDTIVAKNLDSDFPFFFFFSQPKHSLASKNV